MVRNGLNDNNEFVDAEIFQPFHRKSLTDFSFRLKIKISIVLDHFRLEIKILIVFDHFSLKIKILKVCDHFRLEIRIFIVFDHFRLNVENVNFLGV